MIAAKRRRAGGGFGKVPATLGRWSRNVDRAANRVLERAHPPLLGLRRRGQRAATRAGRWLGPRLRPAAALFFRTISRGERVVRRLCALAVGAATAASEVVTPRRAIGALIFAAGIFLIASQFIDYRGVEIGQPGYAGLPDVAAPPSVAVRTAGAAHAYLLVPLGAIAAALGLIAALRDRRWLGLTVAALGLVSVAVILLIDLPHGLDAGAQTSRFAGASAVLDDGFYAELAAAGGMVLAGLLYYARPCRIRINSSGRAASARRRRPRRRASSRARVARRA
jgi:hypothetical protein